jgi:hypothetical protein
VALFASLFSSLASTVVMPPKKKVAGKSAPAASGDDRVHSRDVELISYPELQERKRQIIKRLDDISVPDAQKKRFKYICGSGKRTPQALPATNRKEHRTVANEEVVPCSSKIDTHWDFVMKGKEQQLHAVFELMK